jgi:hypothetical protein
MISERTPKGMLGNQAFIGTEIESAACAHRSASLLWLSFSHE